MKILVNFDAGSFYEQEVERMWTFSFFGWVVIPLEIEVCLKEIFVGTYSLGVAAELISISKIPKIPHMTDYLGYASIKSNTTESSLEISRFIK